MLVDFVLEKLGDSRTRKRGSISLTIRITIIVVLIFLYDVKNIWIDEVLLP